MLAALPIIDSPLYGLACFPTIPAYCIWPIDALWNVPFN
jgi:hypothetical protein